MINEITVQQVLERMQKNLGVAWRNGSDGVLAGSPSAIVTGIVTTWAPSLEVMKKTVAAKKNLIISRESPFWIHETARPEFSGSGAGNRDALKKDPTFQYKQDFINNNKLTILRFSDNWNARKPDGQMKALGTALGWERFRKPDAAGTGHEVFVMPATTLGGLIKGIQDRLKTKSMRVLGDPQAKINKVALTHGFILVPALAEVLKEPDIDVLVTGEPVEWEAHPYFEDWITAGKAKGMINLGSQVSEEPGSGEVAAWLKSFVSEVPVEWIPAGEPFWPVKA